MTTETQVRLELVKILMRGGIVAALEEWVEAVMKGEKAAEVPDNVGARVEVPPQNLPPKGDTPKTREEFAEAAERMMGEVADWLSNESAEVAIARLGSDTLVTDLAQFRRRLKVLLAHIENAMGWAPD